MPITSYEDITADQYDVLKEIGNIGLGNATTALSQMLNRKIDMRMPKVELVDLSHIADRFGGEETPVLGILMTLAGDIYGMMMFVMGESSARQLADLLLGKESSAVSFDHMDLSALKEIGHIITGAYLTAISTLTGLKIESSVPAVSYDMAGAVLSVPAIEFGKLGDKALIMDSSFDNTEDAMDGYFVMLPDMESYNKMMSIFGL